MDSAEASGDQFKMCGVASSVYEEGRSVAATMDYDFSCLNFASGKTMKSRNIGCSCPALFPRKAIKHRYANSRSAPRAARQSGGKAFKRCSDI